MTELDVVLLHGGWHCSASWGPLVPALQAHGHRAVAPDLLGHGWHARYPAGYFAEGQPGLATGVTTLPAITVEAAADAVVDTLTVVRSDRPVVLVSHSSAGAIAGLAAQKAPEQIDHLVYVAAIVPSRLPSALAYAARPEYGSQTMDGLVIGDPLATGTLRINPRSTDPQYRDLLHRKFYGDLPADAAAAFLDLLSPDQPLGYLADPVTVTADRWGSIPRTYVRTAKDQSIALAVQDIMIEDADALTPENRFRTVTIDSGHSPFASRPGELAGIISGIEPK